MVGVFCYAFRVSVNKSLTTAVAAVVLIGAAVALVSLRSTRRPSPTAPSPASVSAPGSNGSTLSPAPAAGLRPSPSFSEPKKSAHYENNTPAHGAVFPAPPPEVVVDFNFDLAAPSAIEIVKDGVQYGREEIIIDPGKLSMRRAMDLAAPDGVYTVNYRACWPDGSCHEGHFQFAVDRQAAGAFMDFTGSRDVAVAMISTSFLPSQIRIRRGTNVTWRNEDPFDHFVNTDPHPQHTGFALLNSRALAQGATYSYTFDVPGTYAYHCSAHADVMHGTVLVE